MRKNWAIKFAISALLMLSASRAAWADVVGALSGSKQNSMSQFVVLGLFFVFLYFMIIRPQSKRAKEHKTLVEAIAKDDEVVTSGGLVGKVTKVTDQFLKIAIADGVEVTIQKGMILSSLPKGTIKAL